MSGFSNQQIVQALRAYGVQASPELCGQIRTYAERLLQWNRKVNLTAIIEPEEILRRHFGESLLASPYVPLEGLLVDIGSGAGFPGLVLKLFRPALSVVLVEPNNKKATFLREVSRCLSLQAVKVAVQNFEEFDVGRPLINIVTSRAVGDYRNILDWCNEAQARHVILWLGSKESESVMQDNRFQWEKLAIPRSDNSWIAAGKRS